MNRKATIKDTFVIVILAVTAMTIIMIFTQNIANDNGFEITDQANETLGKLQNYSKSFNEVRDNFVNLSDSAQEAQVGDFAYFGIRGMVAIMKLPFKIIGTVGSAVQAVGLIFARYVDPVILAAISGVLMIGVIFAAIKFLTSRGQEP